MWKKNRSLADNICLGLPDQESLSVLLNTSKRSIKRPILSSAIVVGLLWGKTGVFLAAVIVG